MAYKARKRKAKKTVSDGIAHIRVSFNNTIVSITDKEGNVITWASAGTIGIKGSKKSTPYAASQAAEKAAKEAVSMGMKTVDAVTKGLGAGRETAIRALQSAGLEVKTIKDETPIPHNGCRPPKRRCGN